MIWPNEVWRHHARMVQSLEALWREIEEERVAVPQEFVGIRPDELGDVFQRLRAELDLQTTLALVASFEGVVRRDFESRARSKATDATTRTFRHLFGEFGGRTDLEEVLDGWAETVTHRALGEFRQLLPFRNWLAHGRYWHYDGPLKSVTPELSLDRGTALLAALGLRQR